MKRLDMEDQNLLVNIAEYIAMNLESYTSKFSADGEYVKVIKQTSIGVYQQKTKFSYIRIYWQPAEETLVRNMYEARQEMIAGALPGSAIRKHIKEEMTLEEFKAARYITDCAHYRDVYLGAKQMWPKLWDFVGSEADNQEFLLPTYSDFEHWQDNLHENLKHQFDDKKKKVIKIIYGRSMSSQ